MVGKFKPGHSSMVLEWELKPNPIWLLLFASSVVLKVYLSTLSTDLGFDPFHFFRINPFKFLSGISQSLVFLPCLS